MRTMIMASVFALALGGSAQAQVDRLPIESHAERQVNSINRSLAIDQRERRQDQQFQFEVNQLRGQFQRNQMFPPPGRGCVTGAVAC